MSFIKKQILKLIITIALDFGVALVVTGLVVLATVEGKIAFGAVTLVLGLTLLFVATMTSLYLILTNQDK